MPSARTDEGYFSKREGSCDAIATLESTRTFNALKTKDRSSTCVYSICESIWANAVLKACAIDGIILAGQVREGKSFAYLLGVLLRPTVARQSCPDLGNQNRPHLRLCLTTLRLRVLLKIEHALREGDKVGHKVLEW